MLRGPWSSTPKLSWRSTLQSSNNHMVLHLVGVGLGDEQDITLKGLNALKRCSKIYLEAYTSVLTVPKEQLEEAWGVAIEIADRQLCEEGCEEAILQRAMTEEVALLVVGDPFGATTHSDLLHRAREMAVPTNVVCHTGLEPRTSRLRARPRPTCQSAPDKSLLLTRVCLALHRCTTRRS